MASVQISFIDVRQGDSSIIVSPEGRRAILVDCPSGHRGAALRELEYLGIRELRWVVVTHSDLDHAGAVYDVIKDFRRMFGSVREIAFQIIDRFVLERVQRGQGQGDEHGQGRDDKQAHNQAKGFRSLLLDLAELQETVPHTLPRAGVELGFDGMSVLVLHPSDADCTRFFASNDRNEASVVLRVEYQQRVALLTADVQGQGLERLIQRGGPEQLRAGVMKVPHHGAWYDHGVSIPMLLDLVQPTHMVISAGTGNNHLHPREETLSALRDYSTGGLYRRFVCTEVTGHCQADVQGATPCAGTVRIRLSADSVSMEPTASDHAHVIDAWATPGCRLIQLETN